MEVDIRVRSPEERSRFIRLCLRELEPGRTIRIVSDSDPWPIRSDMEIAHPGCSTWTYVESGPHVWRVDVRKTHHFERLEDGDLLADSPRLRISQIRLPAGTQERVMQFKGNAALIFDHGAGTFELSGHRRAVTAGTVEIVCVGETCTVSASTDLHAYVAIAK